MARRNTSGSSSGRRGSSRSNSGERSFSGSKKSSDKPYKKSSPRSEKSAVQKREHSSFEGRATTRSAKTGKPLRRKQGDSVEGAQKHPKGGKITKGPSFGLPYKRTYGKKKRDSDDNASSDVSRSAKEPRGFFKKSKSRYSERKKPYKNERTAPAPTEKIRLNKFIANSGVCSRREADELITMGLIAVNGKTITELGYKVNPGDEVRYENKILKAEKPVYILLNKPKGYLTTTDDPQERNTVMHIIGSAVKERIYPVGRLDRNTTGLLLLTNDGDLADKLMHPSYNIKKIYKVELDRPLTKADFQTVQEGVMLEEGRAVVDDLAIVSDDGKTVGLEIHIGWNRVVRRIFENLGYEIKRLDRSVYAGLDKKNLGRGQWRFLTKEEIVRLKHYK